MLIGLPIAIILAGVTWVFSPKIGVDLRGRISITALSAASATSATAGFMYNNIAGVCTISACFFIVAILFGYERN
jgi:hypothetical protein